MKEQLLLSTCYANIYITLKAVRQERAAVVALTSLEAYMVETYNCLQYTPNTIGRQVLG